MFHREPTDAATPYGLRVDGRPSPALGVDSAHPRLSWRLPSDVGDAAETAVEARYAGSAEPFFVTRVPLDVVAVEVVPAVQTTRTVEWRVGIDGPEGMIWSEEASFEVAPEDERWPSAWITSQEWAAPAPGHNGPPPVLGVDFELPAPVVRARLSLAACGTVCARLNGQPATDEVLGFGYSVERERLPGRVLDVTSCLRAGVNTLRVTVGPGISWVPPVEGRYTKLTTAALPPRLRAYLEIECEDGTRTVVASGADWRASTGPVRSAHWYGGEDADGRIAEPDAPVDDSWGPCVALEARHPVMWLRRPPLRITERIAGTAVAVSKDTAIIDFGTNVAGWPTLRLTGCRGGETLYIRPAELLHEGEIDQRTTGSPIWDVYTARPGDQLWHPRHVYHGFRYIEVSGIDPSSIEAEAAVIRADNERVGFFETDDGFLRTLHTIIDRAVQGNMYSVFTDCPSREKLGWIEQLYLCFGLLTRMYDVEAHLADTVRLMCDAQLPGGLVPSIVPQTADFSGIEFGGDPTAFVDDVNWGGAIAHVALLHYREYGDRRVLADVWSSVSRYLDHVRSRSVDGILDYGLGDWVALDESTPRAMVATYGWIRLLRAAAEIAEVVGDPARTAALRRDAVAVERAFTSRFASGEGAASWGSGSQASYVLPLDLGIVPPAEVDEVVHRLAQAIESAGNRLTVGENTWPAMLRVLTSCGRSDLIDRMVRNGDGPGYGMQIALGATSLTEKWRGASGVMLENSQNHFMLGMVDDWIAGDVAGLGQSEGSTAWRHALVAPEPSVGGRTRIAHTSTRGAFMAAAEPASRTLRVVVPSGAECTVVLPVEWVESGERIHRLPAGRWVWSA